MVEILGKYSEKIHLPKYPKRKVKSLSFFLTFVEQNNKPKFKSHQVTEDVGLIIIEQVYKR